MAIEAYYSASVCEFLDDDSERLLGVLASHHHHALEELQCSAWLEQVSVLKAALSPKVNGKIFLEVHIPRMGKRADAVLLLRNVVLVLEFKIRAKHHVLESFRQVEDYALDLKNFHEGSHAVPIVPLLISTDAASSPKIEIRFAEDLVASPVASNAAELGKTITQISESIRYASIDHHSWMAGGYKPTPTIVEAAQVLYRTHSVTESRDPMPARETSVN